MSLLDKFVATVMPLESEEKRMEARAQARAKAAPGGWLAAVLDHHEQIEAAFAAVRAAGDPGARRAAQKRLAIVLTGHANAEESVLYPALAKAGHKAHASLAYEEQAVTKIEMALLEKLDPMSEDFIDKLEHIRGAVAHHMYQEESDWFPDLMKDDGGADGIHLAARFQEEMDRYVGKA